LRQNPDSIAVRRIKEKLVFILLQDAGLARLELPVDCRISLECLAAEI
jgi:hypothetical protein